MNEEVKKYYEELMEKLKDVTAGPELITPEIAAEMLTHNIRNRRLKKGRIPAYVRDIIAMRCRANGESIVFDEDGVLVDGQNRLYAILSSGIAVPFLVVRGIPKSEAKIYNRGVIRTAWDTAVISGITPTDISCSYCTAIARFLLSTEIHRNELTDSEILDAIIRSEEAFRFVKEQLSSAKARGVRSAGVGAAEVAAFECDYPVGRLRRFNQVLLSGESEGKDEFIIVKLRNKLAELPTSGQSYQKAINGYTQRALSAYLSGENLQKLYLPSSPIYTIPDERRLF